MATAQHRANETTQRARVWNEAVLRGGRQSWATTVALGIVALAVRVYVAVAWAGQPVWDGHYYDFGAKRIAQGFGYSDDIVMGAGSQWHPWCHYPVGYSGFLAGIYRVFGTSELVAPVTNAFLGAVVVMLTHRIGLMWLTPARALIAAIMCTASAELILYTPVVMTEILATAAPLLAIWVMLVCRQKRPFVGAVATGLVTGLMTLVQPQLILFAPPLGALAGNAKNTAQRNADSAGKFTAKWGSQRWILTALITTATALCVVAPWTIRNCRVMDGCTFVSTNGGWNLAIGAVPGATGRFVTLRASDGCAIVTGQVQQDRCWAEVGLQAIRKDFPRWLSLIPRKLSHCFDHASFPVEYLHQANPHAWSEQRRAWWRGVLTGIHRVTMSVGAFAFVGLRQRKWRMAVPEVMIGGIVGALVILAWTSQTPIFWPLPIAMLATALIPRPSKPTVGAAGMALVVSLLLVVVTHAVFFGEDRYHVRLIPVFCLFTAAVFRPGKQLRA